MTSSKRERIRDTFDREITEMQRDHEPSIRIAWMRRLRDEVLAILREETA